jgi:hypothetical protein
MVKSCALLSSSRDESTDRDTDHDTDADVGGEDGPQSARRKLAKKEKKRGRSSSRSTVTSNPDPKQLILALTKVLDEQNPIMARTELATPLRNLFENTNVQYILASNPTKATEPTTTPSHAPQNSDLSEIKGTLSALSKAIIDLQKKVNRLDKDSPDDQDWEGQLPTEDRTPARESREKTPWYS